MFALLGACQTFAKFALHHLSPCKNISGETNFLKKHEKESYTFHNASSRNQTICSSKKLETPEHFFSIFNPYIVQNV